MAESNVRVMLDTVRKNRVNIIYAVQNDYGARYITATITVDGRKQAVGQTAMVTINAERADGQRKAFEGEVNADGTVKVPVTQWMLAVEGEVVCSISAVTSTSRLTTTYFYIQAQHSIWDGTSEPSEDDPNKDVILTIIASENERAESEKARISAESKRVKDEAVRAENEKTRVENEEARVANENTRIENEAKRKAFFEGVENVLTNKNIDSALGDSDTLVASQGTVKRAFENTLLQSGKESDMPFMIGGLNTADGTHNDFTNRVRSKVITSMDFAFSLEDGLKCMVFWYDKNGLYLGSSTFTRGLVFARQELTPVDAALFRVLLAYEDNAEIDDIEDFLLKVDVVKTGGDVTPFWESGTLASADGSESDNVTRIRSGIIPMEDLYITANNVEYNAVFYDENVGYIESKGFRGDPVFLKEIAPESAAFVRFAVRDKDNASINTEMKIGIYGKALTFHKADSQEYVETFKEKSDSMKKSLYSKTLTPKFVLGGLQSADGSENDLATRAKSVLLDDIKLRVTLSDGIKINLFFYRADQFLTASGFMEDGEIYTAAYAPKGATHLRILTAYQDDAEIKDVSALAEKIRAYAMDDGVEFTHDVPENEGVLNAILNFKELAEIRYTPKAVIPQQTGDFAAGVERVGLPYSSTRPEGLFVPNNVSFHTFMSALLNPNSYLYTVALENNQNGKTYYGAVCSTAAEYALNIEPNYTTHQWTDIPGMEVLENQSVYGLKLCDTIVGNGHVVMITDITRDSRGRIGFITVSEAAGANVHSTVYTPSEVEALYPPSAYTYCRYQKLYAVKHVPNPFVAVEDETPQTVKMNTAIIPRKGDKANYLQGADVVIDILEKGTFTNVEIYKDGKSLRTDVIADSVTISAPTTGSYQARLTDGTNHSDWCYFMVVNAKSSAEPSGYGGKVKVTFSASNATPLYVQIVDGEYLGGRFIHVLSDNEKTSGKTEFAYQSGKYKIRVAFKTGYGIIFSALSDVINIVGEPKEEETFTLETVHKATKIHDSQISANSNRITNLEKIISPEPFYTDDTLAYTKDVPENTLPFAAVTEIGGMTYNEDGTLYDTKVTAVESVGANLFSGEISKKTAPTTYTFDHGTLSIQRNGGAIQGGVWSKEKYKSGTYTISFTLDVTNSANFILSKIKEASEKNIGTILKSWYAKGYTSHTFTLTEDCYLGFFTDIDNVKITAADVMLTKGEEAQPYSPYFKNILPIPEEVQSLDGYGRGVNADYHNKIVLEPANGVKKFVNITKQVVFTGTENWIASDYGDVYVDANAKLVNDTAMLICDRYNSVSFNDRINYTNAIAYISPISTTRIGIFFRNTGYSTVNEWKAYLAEQYAAGTPVTVDYVLNESTEIDLSEYFTDDNFIEVEGGGTITAANEFGYAVPTKIEYMLKGVDEA